MRTYTDLEDRYNTKIKVYPNGLTKTVYCNTAIFKYEEDKHIIDTPPKKRVTTKKDDNAEKRSDNVKRAKDKLFDLIYCNDWDYFLSITFNPEEVDSYNVKEVMQKISKWLNNCVYRRGLRYVLVPEYHKSGRIHCHALINGVFTFVDSGKKSHGRKVYNVPEWKYGFSTAVKTSGDKLRMSCYITKYITKDSKPIFGRFYWSSRNLVREPKVYLENNDFNNLDIALDFQCYEIKKAHLIFKYANELTVSYGGDEATGYEYDCIFNSAFEVALATFDKNSLSVSEE